VSINLTLIVQMFVFALLIWFTMKFVWPMILGAMDERAKRIADGLAAAEQGQKDLAQAQTRADDAVREARSKAVQIVDHAQHRANELIDQAKVAAVAEGERLIASAHQQIQLESQRARENLRQEVASLAVAGASRLLEREIDPKAHADLLNGLASELGAIPRTAIAEEAARRAVDTATRKPQPQS
jgi:F-type H+-transporting ATPase subunit b